MDDGWPQRTLTGVVVRGHIRPRQEYEAMRLRAAIAVEQIGPQSFQPIVLTPREREVLKLLAEGKTDREIAAALALSAAAVRNHSQHILEKLDVHNRHEAVRRARRLGWVF